MRKYLKKALPGLYSWYQHIQRRKKISEIGKLKELSEAEIIQRLGILYEQRIGHKLDWENLSTYTEKMQWEKIYDNNPQKVILADKYLVRQWIMDTIGEEYLIPLLGVWEKFEDIDFDKLPDKFVMKTNHGTGTNYIVKCKNKMNLKDASRTFADWLETDYAYACGFEMHYSKIQPKIIVEKYMETEYGELQDYKFLCFDGKPYFVWVDMGRYSDHTRNVYDLEWNLQPWKQERYGLYKEAIPKPKNFELMIDLVKKLSEGFSHVRVDMYNVNGKIYFAEMTFTNGSGLDRIIPNEYDQMLGDLWKLDMSKKQFMKK